MVAMSKSTTNTKKLDPNHPIPRRLDLIGERFGEERRGLSRQRDFAENVLGIGYKRWRNYCRGYPPPGSFWQELEARVPGLDVHWVWYGDTMRLSPAVVDRLGLLPGGGDKAVAKPAAQAVTRR